MTSQPIVKAPAVDLDLYAESVLEDSRDAFARIRDEAPVVWLPRHRMYAMGRFSDVRAALRNDEVFRSGAGVAANALSNRMGRDTTLFSDDETHTKRRKVMMRSLGAKALTDIEARVDAQATELVERLCARDWFEASTDFSAHLPLSVVADLVGVRQDGQRMLRWAAATFDSLGPINRRGLRAARTSIGLLAYTRRLDERRVRPGSWAASVFEARDRGELTTTEAKALCIDFVAPALDTTILASTHLLWVLARNPDAWQRIRQDPDSIPRAVVENVRLASPIRGFTRTVARDHEVDAIPLAAGARVAVLFGAANLDEREFDDPERFDPTRENKVQLGWGNGAHTCVGIHLAKIEMQALLRAMVERVQTIEVGTPQRLHNNTLQGVAHVPARFIPV
jgi:cytochrome P450